MFYSCSVKDVNCLTAYTGDLFIVVKDCVEPISHLEWTDNRRMVH